MWSDDRWWVTQKSHFRNQTALLISETKCWRANRIHVPHVLRVVLEERSGGHQNHLDSLCGEKEYPQERDLLLCKLIVGQKSHPTGLLFPLWPIENHKRRHGAWMLEECEIKILYSGYWYSPQLVSLALQKGWEHLSWLCPKVIKMAIQNFDINMVYVLFVKHIQKPKCENNN